MADGRNGLGEQPPRSIGSSASPLLKKLDGSHYEAKLTDGEMRRLAAWIDCNAIFYGSFDPAEQARQLAGETLPMPPIQ